MNLIVLKPKTGISGPPIVIVDDAIIGALGNVFLIDYTYEMKIVPLMQIVERYRFPEKEGRHTCRLLPFLTGLKPELIEDLSFYEVKNENDD